MDRRNGNGKLRVLQLGDHSEILSGGAMQMFLLAQGLNALGHEVTCVFDSRETPHDHTLDRVTQAGLRLERVPMDKKSISHELRRLVEEECFDVIHTHRASYKVLLRSCRDLELPVVLVNRGHSRPVRGAERRKLFHPAVRGLVVVAKHVQDVLVDGGIPRERIEVVYGSYDPARFHPEVDGTAVRNELLEDTDPRTRLVGLVAKLSHYKSHDLFLEAAARVLQRFDDVRFVLVGPDADDVWAGLQSHARDLQNTYGVALVSKIHYTGPRQDIPQVMAALDVSVSASATAYEGLSGVMRESLAMACPVVCTDVGGNRELVRDGETGRLVPPGDVGALAGALVDLLGDPDRAAALGQAGRHLARQQFSNSFRAQRMEALYRRHLGRTP